MKKSELPEGIRTLKKWSEKGEIDFDLPFQRASGQWRIVEKSLLVHSILIDFPGQSLYFTKETSADKKNIVYGVVDGKQRLTSLFEFIDGNYILHGSTPSVIIDDKEIELANKSFADLPDDVKDLILGFRFHIYLVEDTTEKELEDIFERLNSGTPLTLIQKARAVMGTELATWTRAMTCSPFFQNSVPMTLAQARRESELEILLQSMLLLDARHQNYDYKGISMREVTKYCKEIRGNYPTEKRDLISKTVTFLTEAFPEKTKFLKKTNAVMVFLMADIALENNITPKDFNAFIQYFSENVPFEYEENTGAGNIKRTKTEGRLKAMQDSMEKYFKLKGIKEPTKVSTPTKNILGIRSPKADKTESTKEEKK